ncbi:MAG: FxsA family protein [Lentisphaeraceae bacterium]|nr:FxsA family protein [Lentisphaeraceae bacterium]
MGKFLILFFILTFSEVYLMKVVAEKTSFLFLFSVVLITGIIGLSLAKKQGREHLIKVQQELAAGRIPGNPLVEGLMILVAAAVLITPGFITDVLGFLLLVPFIRRLLAPALFSLFKPKMSTKGSTFFHFSAGGNFKASPKDDSKPVVDAEFFDMPDEDKDDDSSKKIEG